MSWSIFTDGGGPLAAGQWAADMLAQGHYPVTAGNVGFVFQWEESEGGGGRWNPLNQGDVPGQPQLTSTGSQYGGGAADYVSRAAGITGAVAYLNMGNYTHVKAALMANNAAAARSALIASPWAASHYGYGANFSKTPIPPAVLAGLNLGGVLSDLTPAEQQEVLQGIRFLNVSVDQSPGGVGWACGQILNLVRQLVALAERIVAKLDA